MCLLHMTRTHLRQRAVSAASLLVSHAHAIYILNRVESEQRLEGITRHVMSRQDLAILQRLTAEMSGTQRGMSMHASRCIYVEYVKQRQKVA